MRTARLRVAILSAAVVLLGLATTATVAIGTGFAPKPDFFPDEGLTDAERERRIEAARERERQFVIDFEASGRDPRDLPRVYVESWAPAPATLADLAAQADIIVTGTVRETHFQPTDAMPMTTSVVVVRDVLKGTVGSAITVEQLGGPLSQGDETVLAALESDPLILAGDEVLLFLRSDPRGPTYMPANGGTFLLTGGTIRAIETPEGSPVGASMNGKLVGDVAAELAALE